MLNSEIWKNIEGFNGRYQVSTLGRVRNNRGRILKAYINNSGYACLKLAGGAQVNFLVHRLVASAFVKNADPSTQTVVNHINFNRLDNKASNLEWCSTQENLKASRVAGRMPYNRPTLGVKLSGQRKGTSQFHGVFRRDYQYKGVTRERWWAYLRVAGKTLETKSFPTELEAAQFYDLLLAKYKVSHKPKNFPNQTETPNDYPAREYSQAAGNGSHPG